MLRLSRSLRVALAGGAAVALAATGLQLVAQSSAGAAAGDATTLNIEAVYPSDRMASAGTCMIFRAVPKTGLGEIASDTGTVVITLKESPNSGTQDVDFCLPPTAPDGQTGTVPDRAQYTNAPNGSGTPAPASTQRYCAGKTALQQSITPPSAAPCSSATDNPDDASNDTLTTNPFVGTNTNPSGTDTVPDAVYTNSSSAPNRRFIQFGVVGLVPGQATIDACIDRSGNGRCGDTGDIPAAQVTATFTSGGAPQTVPAFDAVTNITTDRQQYVAVQSTSTSANIALTLLNREADTVFGVTPNFRVQSGPNASSTINSCSGSDDFGLASCSYRGTTPGTDTLLFWVNHSAAPNSTATAGPDPGEPTQQVTVTTFAQPAPASSARFIDLTPNSPTSTEAGASKVFTATVTDSGNAPVQGATVTFSETGPGQLQGGTSPDGNNSSLTVSTGPDGRATATVITRPGEAGNQTVTASISPNTTDCGRIFNGSAGTCSDSTTNVIGGGASASPTPTASQTRSATPTPTATASGSPTPSATATATATRSSTPSPACQTAQVTVNTPTINATGLASVTVFGATPNSRIELQGYSQDHFGSQNFDNDPTPVDRAGTTDSSGALTFNDLRPSSNTRVRARQVGCGYGDSAVIEVRTTIFLKVTRDGPRTYTFAVDSIPARPGGLIVSIYRITGNTCPAGVEPRDCPGEPYIAQTRVSSIDGSGSRTLRFDSSFGGREQFVLKTGRDAQNAPGRSNVRDLAIF